MGLFKKKGNQEELGQIPELPELPKPNEFSLPELPKPIGEPGLENTSGLPQLPELKVEPNLQPQIIKQEITNPQQRMQKSHFEGKIKTTIPQIQRPPELPAPLPSSRDPHTRQIAKISPRLPIKEIEPIYVRLDKFEASLDSFEQIKNKLIEIEEVLRKIREIKQKEELELEEWEREIQVLKSRIDAIDKTIFNKLD